MNKLHESALNISQLMSLHGWGLRRYDGSKIIVTRVDGSGAVLNKDDKNNSIAETMFYRMMDDFLQNSGFEVPAPEEDATALIDTWNRLFNNGSNPAHIQAARLLTKD